MTTLEATLEAPVDGYKVTKRLDDFVDTAAASESQQTSRPKQAESRANGWQKILDQFIRWSENPSQLDEDDWESPAIKAIRKASQLILRMRDQDLAIPTRAASSGEGGIIIESNREPFAEEIEIDSEGVAEYRCFQNSRLIDRRIIQ